MWVGCALIYFLAALAEYGQEEWLLRLETLETIDNWPLTNHMMKTMTMIMMEERWLQGCDARGSFKLLQCLLCFLRKFSLMCRFCWSLSVEQNCVFFLLEQNAFWKIGRLDKYSDRGWPGKCEYRAPWIYFLFFHIRRNAFVGTLSFLLLIKTEIRNPTYSEKSVQQ